MTETTHQIIDGSVRRCVMLEVPEWNGSVQLATPPREDIPKMIEALQRKDGMIRATIAALFIVDDKGQRMFSDKDVPRLGECNFNALDRIFHAANTLWKQETEGDG